MSRNAGTVIAAGAFLFVVASVPLHAKSEADLRRGREEMNRREYALAERDYKAALADAEKHGDPIRGYLACSGLAQLAQLQAQPDAQEEYLLGGYQWRLRLRRPNAELPPLLALHDFYRRQRRWKNDIDMLQHVISLWSNSAGPDALGLAQFQYKLAEAYRGMDDTSNAEDAFRKALSIFEANGMADSPAAARVMVPLATILADRGQAEEAGKLFEFALKPLKGLGEESAAFTSASNAYAHFLRQLGRTDEANTFEVKPVAKGTRQTPELIFKREPEYTTPARDKRLAGRILLSLIVDEAGRPENVEVLEPLGLGLDQNAVKAVSGWKFEPAQKDGRPVRCPATVEVNFSLL